MALADASLARAGSLLALWRDVRVRRILFQVAFVIVVFWVAYILYTNLDRSLERTGLKLFPFVALDTDFPFLHLEKDFLGQRAGFNIEEKAFGVDYTPNSSYYQALLAGLSNTIRVSLLGIVLASLLGLLIGVARLSRNWLVSSVATAYVETVRNIPLLVQLVFWYLAVYLKAPRIGDALNFFDVAYLSNRAVAVPWFKGEDAFDLWLLLLVVALLLAAVVKVLLTRREEATGRPSYPWAGAFAAFILAAAVSYVIAGRPFSIDTPERGATSFSGGAVLTPEFAALLTGLVVYTAAFIAEIVRGSILAIPKGQTEASAAIGLNPFQRLRYVILPQAMLIIIPPLTNQYLNLMKNSSLAVAVGFKDLFDVTRISINQAGQAVPLITLVMLIYLSMSLTVSLIMNTLYSRLRWTRAR